MIQLSDYGFKHDCTHLDGVPARVIAVHRERYEIITPQGLRFARCKTAAYRTKDALFPTIGDDVVIKDNPQGDSLILRTLPRLSQFLRSDYSGHAAGYVKTIREQVVAANFDEVFLLQSLNDDLNLPRLERYLTLARQSGGRPVVVLTKLDLVTSAEEALNGVHQTAPDVPVYAVSSVTGAGMEQLAPYLTPGRTLALLGSSGAGKSSLVNFLAGETVMRTGEIRQNDSKGRHTTTERRIIRLPSGTLVMDTPGMREMGLWDAEEGIAETFPDVEALVEQCRFTDCRHDTEPGCAVRAALQSGALSAERWARYNTLMRETRFVAGKKRT